MEFSLHKDSRLSSITEPSEIQPENNGSFPSAMSAIVKESSLNLLSLHPHLLFGMWLYDQFWKAYYLEEGYGHVKYAHKLSSDKLKSTDNASQLIGVCLFLQIIRHWAILMASFSVARSGCINWEMEMVDNFLNHNLLG